MKNPARKESVHFSAFRTQRAVVHVSAIMHTLSGHRGTYFRGGGGGGYVLSGHCNRQKISVKTEGVLIFGGVLIYGVFPLSLSFS